jgi:precorrin-6B methylase 2
MTKKTIRINEPYYHSIEDIIHKKLKLLHLKDGEVLVDLGCGDARNLIEACSLAKISCIGYEILPEAIIDANANIKKNSLENRIEIRAEDFFEADISTIKVLIIYLTRYALGELSLKLENELPKGARIVTHQFDIPAWEADKEIDYLQKNGQTEKIFLYTKK